MTAADMFRGLAEIDFTAQPGADPNDPYQAAFPTFRKISPNRDEVVLRRRAPRAAARSASSPRRGGLAAFDEGDVPAVFRALNAAGVTNVAAFPTFTYGLSQGFRFMNIVDLRPAAFQRQIAPAGTPGLTDLANVEALDARRAGVGAIARLQGSVSRPSGP